MAWKEHLKDHWPTVTIAVTAAAIAGGALMLFRTMPPRTVVMVTGPEGGAYHEFGTRYRAILARSDVDLRLVPTGGAQENLALLLDPRSGASVALLQGGTTTASEAPVLESLGTMFYEPLWLFHRSEIRGNLLEELRGRKISIGPEGSGTRALSLELLKRMGFDQAGAQLLALTPQSAGEQLLAGEIDAALMLIAWELARRAGSAA
jgi:TRAP-type uncharacterized transport system substrate-binding protein